MITSESAIENALTKSRNELERAGTTWNKPEPPEVSLNHLTQAGTIWNHLKQGGTTYNEMISATN